jgi:membrane fusion protein, heavy metal efflux system
MDSESNRQTDIDLRQHEWPRTWQVRALALGGAVILLTWLGVSLRTYFMDTGGRVTVGAAAAPPDGAFRATSAQLADLKIEPVTKMEFRTEHITEGRIALNGDKTTQVFSPYSGRVVKVMAALGDSVREGTPLLAVAASEFVQGQNDLINAAAQLNLTQANAKRKQALYESKGGSLQDAQQSQADLVNAENALASVRNRLRILGKTDAQIAAMEHEQTIDSVAYVLAPISGVVTDRQIGPGQYIQSGASTAVYTIGDLSTVWMVADVREADAPFVRRGQPVEVRVLALPDRVFKAHLNYVAAAVGAATRRLSVHAQIDNSEGLLKPEMFATFTIATGAGSDALAVPGSAVVYEGDTARVWLAQDGGALALRPIQIGRGAHGMFEVLAGLAPTDKVVTRGSLFIDRAAKSE